MTEGSKEVPPWTVGAVFASIGLFVLAGVAEVGGGWLVWQTIRNAKPWWWALLGSVILVAYGFIPTLQPEQLTFGRAFAVYGGFFIILSYAFGWLLDGNRPDVGDWTGSAIALAGVLVALFWPR
jgi:small multidrug resistance family-3 protein